LQAEKVKIKAHEAKIIKIFVTAAYNALEATTVNNQISHSTSNALDQVLLTAHLLAT